MRAAVYEAVLAHKTTGRSGRGVAGRAGVWLAPEKILVNSMSSAPEERRNVS
jgi:hypothetical protein